MVTRVVASSVDCHVSPNNSKSRIMNEQKFTLAQNNRDNVDEEEQKKEQPFYK